VVSRGGPTGDTVAPVSRGSRQPNAEEAEASESSRPAVSADSPAGTATHDDRRKMARKWPRAARRFAAWWETPAALDLAICLVYASFAFWVTHGLWPDPANRAIADNANDQALIEWFLAHGVLFWTGDFSLVTYRLNAPDGVNLMSNASHVLHGVMMAPVTVLLGVAVSFALLVGLNVAATAAAWYLLLARTLKLHRAGAAIGGAVAGFAPGMIAQSNSHLHMTAQWLVPAIVWCVIKLTRATTVRGTALTAVGLALLVSAQLLLGEEVLFLTALCLAIFSLVYAACRWDLARRVAPRFLAGMALAAGITVLLVAYPLWVQFRGAQHTPNAPFASEFFYADVASYAVFSPLSIAGSPEAGKLATGPTEYNTYLGVPLLLVLVGCAVWRWRSPVTIAAGTTGIVMALLSLGPYVTMEGRRTGWPSLYSLIAEVPVVNGALPTRYALALIPLIGLLLAYALDAALRQSGFVRVAVPIAVVAALLPIAPKPLAAMDRAPVPEFITSGAWRQCAPEGGVLVPVPLPTPQRPDLMRWPATADAAFAIPEGFFIGPYGPGGASSIGIYPRPTSLLLAEVAQSGTVPAVDDGMRLQARNDLAYWRADCVAVAHVPNEAALRETLESLLGPGTQISGTWAWRAPS
jgi:hypothetical protein